VDLLAQRTRRIQLREDRRAALAAWAQIELNRDREKRSHPFTLEEVVGWLGHGFQEAPPATPTPAAAPTTDELIERAQLFMQFAGAQNVNGVLQGEAHGLENS
jgi:hypothetical protein